MSELKKNLTGADLDRVTGGDNGGEEIGDMSRCLRCDSKDITVTGAGTAQELHTCNACGWTWHNMADYGLT